MVQVCKKTSASRRLTPKQAGRKSGPIDAVLDPTLFKALSDPTRVRLLGCLVKCGRACTVGEIAECCEVDLSVVSRHLQVLARAGALEASKSGRTMSYEVRVAHLGAVFRGLASALESPSRRACTTGGACGCC